MVIKPKILYISYNSAFEPVSRSQVLPYLNIISEEYQMSLLTFEKEKTDKTLPFRWYRLKYHKWPSSLATMYDVLCGVACVFFLHFLHRYDILHARQLVPASICLIARRFVKFKWVFDMRCAIAEEYAGHKRADWREGNLKYRLTKFIEKKCLRDADYIVTLTEKHAKEVKRPKFLIGEEEMVRCVLND